MNAPFLQDPAPRPLLITVDLFDRMVRCGSLDRFERLELRDGVLYEMNALHIPHARAMSRMARALLDLFPLPDHEVFFEVSLNLDEINQVMPDIVVARPTDGMGPLSKESVCLIVEIADTSLADDLGPKLAKYAAAGIPEYWVVDVQGQAIRLHADPAASVYQQSVTARFGERLTSLTISGITIDTSTLV